MVRGACGAVVAPSARSYSAVMDKLQAFLARLKVRQRDLNMQAAEHGTMPAGSTLKRIAELENARHDNKSPAAA